MFHGQRHTTSPPTDSLTLMFGHFAASTICDAQGSQPFSGSGGRPMWFITMLRSGIRRAVSSTVSICSCVLVIASNTSLPLKNCSQRFLHRGLEQPARVLLVNDEVAHADELLAAFQRVDRAWPQAAGSASGTQPTTARM